MRWFDIPAERVQDEWYVSVRLLIDTLTNHFWMVHYKGGVPDGMPHVSPDMVTITDQYGLVTVGFQWYQLTFGLNQFQ